MRIGDLKLTQILTGPVSLPKKVVIFANGIFNNREEAVQAALTFAKPDVPLFLCYTKDAADGFHKTSNLFKKTTSGFHRFLKNTGDAPERLAHDIEFWVKRGVKVELYAHSRGTLVARQALLKLDLSKKEYRRISLTNYAPIALSPASRVRRVVNYLNVNDAIAFLGMFLISKKRDFKGLTVGEAVGLFNPKDILGSITSLRLLTWRAKDLVGAHSLSNYLVYQAKFRKKVLKILTAFFVRVLRRYWFMASATNSIKGIKFPSSA